MIKVTLKDGSIHEVEEGLLIQIAKAIDPSLAKKSVVGSVNGVLRDLSSSLNEDAVVEFIDSTDPRAFEVRGTLIAIRKENAENIFIETKKKI